MKSIKQPPFPTKEEFIKTFIAYAESREDNDTWAYLKMCDLTFDHPRLAYQIITEIRQNSPSKQVEKELNNAINDLIWKHCSEFANNADLPDDLPYDSKDPAFPTREELLTTWVKKCRGEKSENTTWVSCMISDMKEDYPEEILPFVLEVIRREKSIKVHAITAAGPLEDLLTTHGDKYIDQVESEAKRNPDFKHLLGSVWQNTMSDELWDRVQAIADYSGWD